jgi:hypothetical protein
MIVYSGYGKLNLIIFIANKISLFLFNINNYNEVKV